MRNQYSSVVKKVGEVSNEPPVAENGTGERKRLLNSNDLYVLISGPCIWLSFTVLQLKHVRKGR